LKPDHVIREFIAAHSWQPSHFAGPNPQKGPDPGLHRASRLQLSLFNYQLRLSKYFDSRKNRLHVGSKGPGPEIAAIFSVIESCPKLNIPTRKYLADVLPGLAERSIQVLADLIPTAYLVRLAK